MGKTREGLITVPNKGKFRLLVGMNFDHPKAHNVMGYLRLADYSKRDSEGAHPTVGRELWLSLNDLDKLGTLLLLYSRIFAKTKRKGSGSRKAVMKFIEFWRSLRDEWPDLKPFVPEESE